MRECCTLLIEDFLNIRDVHIYDKLIQNGRCTICEWPLTDHKRMIKTEVFDKFLTFANELLENEREKIQSQREMRSHHATNFDFGSHVDMYDGGPVVYNGSDGGGGEEDEEEDAAATASNEIIV